jgi:hypothetical protein
MDNVRRVVTQAATTKRGKPSLIFPRAAPTSVAELVTVSRQLGDLGYQPSDIAAFSVRILQYLVTSPERRAKELQLSSAYSFFVDSGFGKPPRVAYSEGFQRSIRDMPKVLAAFDSEWGDARTNINTLLQLQVQMDSRDSKADGVLNGPTTEAWFDHWYRHLLTLGVRFVRGAAARLEVPPVASAEPAHMQPRLRVILADDTQIAPDYVVVAVDAPAAERISAPLIRAGTGGTVAGLDRFTTSVCPPDGPLQPAATRTAVRRDPYDLCQMGVTKWDRFQTLAGIQFFFDTEFQLVRGHIYYSDTEWGLSSINQHGLWERRPTLERDGFVSVLSVDIGDFNTPCEYVKGADGLGKKARDCSPDELAMGVWHQIASRLTESGDIDPTRTLPWPAWYVLDRNLTSFRTADGHEGPPQRNDAPYLVPIVGDWPSRPGADPWNPHGGVRLTPFVLEDWLEEVERRHAWQAAHGGYYVHHNSLVYAGTWTKTFTRMTSMEAACESARHAVNAILDHYIWVESGGTDIRDGNDIQWQIPFGFLDQGYSSPVRFPSPAGDYCFVFDVENREPLETRELRDKDADAFQDGRPNPWDTSPLQAVLSTLTTSPYLQGVPLMIPESDYSSQLLAYLKAWRQYLEEVAKIDPRLSALSPYTLLGPLTATPPVTDDGSSPAVPASPPSEQAARPPGDTGDPAWSLSTPSPSRRSLYSSRFSELPTASGVGAAQASAYRWASANEGSSPRPTVGDPTLFGRGPIRQFDSPFTPPPRSPAAGPGIRDQRAGSGPPFAAGAVRGRQDNGYDPVF